MRMKNVLLGLGIFSLVVISVGWFVKIVPKIQFHDTNGVLGSTNNMSSLDGSELKLGDSNSSTVEVPEYCIRSEYSYNTTGGSGCSSTNQKSLCGLASDSKETCYECYSCPGGYSTVGTLTVTAPGGTWKMTTGDNALGLEYSVSCSVTHTGTCEIIGVGDSSYSFPLSAPASEVDYKYSAYVTNGSGSVAGPKLTIQTCPQDWTKGTKTRFFKTLYTQEEAVKMSGDVWMNEAGCTPEVCADKWCRVVSLWRCSSGNWSVRCGANPGEDVCEYEPSDISDELKYANWYNWTREVDDGAKIKAVSQDKCYGCYGNRSTLAKSTVARWLTGKQNKHDPGAGVYKLDEQDSSEKCQAIPEPKVCVPEEHSGAPSSELETEKCEEQKYTFYGDGKWCGSSGITVSESEGNVGGESIYSSDASPFFENKCVVRIGNKFDVEGEDIKVNNTLDVKQGQSVGYEIKSTSIKLCYSKFNVDNWEEAYNLVQRKLTTEESVRAGDDIERAREWYKTVLKAILEQINEYMDWYPKHKNKPKTTIKLVDASQSEQPLNNPKGVKSKIVVEYVEKPCYNGQKGMDDPNDKNNCIPLCDVDENLIKGCAPMYSKCETDTGCANQFEDYRYEIEHDEEDNKIANIEDYGVKYSPSDPQPYVRLLALNIPNGAYVNDVWNPQVDLSTVKNYLWYTTLKAVATFIPEEVSKLNRLNGSIIAGGSNPRESKTAPGYNRIYTAEDIEKGQKYTFNLKMDKVGYSSSVVLNNKCELNVLNRELTYRVIEEDNPFINETRKKGYNWYRTGQDGILYDFTKIIKTSNEYSANYEFDRDSINAIKESNTMSDAYLGACYYGDDHTTEICSPLANH